MEPGDVRRYARPGRELADDPVALPGGAPCGRWWCGLPLDGTRASSAPSKRRETSSEGGSDCGWCGGGPGAGEEPLSGLKVRGRPRSRWSLPMPDRRHIPRAFAISALACVASGCTVETRDGDT